MSPVPALTSVTAGTLFDKSQLGLLKWFKAIWYVVNQTNGVSALGLQRVLGFGSYQTACAWLHKLRRAMEPTSGKLRGKVEVDEIVIGGLEPGVTGRQMFTSVAPSHLDYYLDEFCFRFNRRKSGHHGLLFHNLVKQAANTPPRPYVDLLSDMAGARRRAKEKADRKRRAKGRLKAAPNVPRARPKRPGGARTRLDGEAVRRRRQLPAGRRRKASPGY